MGPLVWRQMTGVAAQICARGENVIFGGDAENGRWWGSWICLLYPMVGRSLSGRQAVWGRVPPSVLGLSIRISHPLFRGLNCGVRHPMFRGLVN